MKDYSNPYTITFESGSKYATLAASGDTSIVAAPGAGKRIYIKEFQVQSEAAVELVILLKSGTTAFRRFILPSKGDGVSMSYDSINGKYLAENVAFVINLSAADTINYYLEYEVREA